MAMSCFNPTDEKQQNDNSSSVVANCSFPLASEEFHFMALVFVRQAALSSSLPLHL